MTNEHEAVEYSKLRVVESEAVNADRCSVPEAGEHALV